MDSEQQPYSNNPDIFQTIADANRNRGILSKTAIIWSIVYSCSLCALFITFFCLTRPRHNAIYAPRLKYGSEEKRPKPIGSGLLKWITSIFKAKGSYETQEKLGLEALVYLRFVRMLRLIFGVMTVIGIGVLLPINFSSSNKDQKQSLNNSNPYTLLTVQYVTGSKLWAHVTVAYVFSIFVMAVIYYNYRVVIRMRQALFNTSAYQGSIAPRTLVVIDLSKSRRTLGAFYHLLSQLGSKEHLVQGVIGRDCNLLTRYVEQHNKSVQDLEKTLQKYFSKVSKGIMQRPTIVANFGPNKGERVDALQYYLDDIRFLRSKIKILREKAEQFGPQTYGFACYDTIFAAEEVYRKHKNDTVLESSTLALGQSSNDILWKNLATPIADRQRKRFIGNLLFITLCILWIVPSALIATFLANISNLGSMWPAFQQKMDENRLWFALIQGIASPLVLATVFLIVPVIARRLSAWGGEVSKSLREKAVLRKLYVFYVLPNFILFTIVQSLFTTFSQASQASKAGAAAKWWSVLRQFGMLENIAGAIVLTNAFWILYLTQKLIISTMTLSQIWRILLRFFKRIFSNDTFRAKIEYSKPPAFEYAIEYTELLFYCTVAFSYSTIAPLILPFMFAYLLLHSFVLKYCFYYVFVTKIETNGSFFKLAINRLIFAMIVANVMQFAVLFARSSDQRWRSYCVLPLLPLWVIFRIFISVYLYPRFDYAQRLTHNITPTVSEKKLKKIITKYAHPAICEPLFVPMVSADQELLLKRLLAEYKVTEREFKEDEDEEKDTEESDSELPQFEFIDSENFQASNYFNRPEFMADADIDAYSIQDSIYTQMESPQEGYENYFASTGNWQSEGAYDNFSNETQNYYMNSSGKPAAYNMADQDITYENTTQQYADPFVGSNRSYQGANNPAQYHRQYNEYAQNFSLQGQRFQSNPHRQLYRENVNELYPKYNEYHETSDSFQRKQKSPENTTRMKYKRPYESSGRSPSDDQYMSSNANTHIGTSGDYYHQSRDADQSSRNEGTAYMRGPYIKPKRNQNEWYGSRNP